MQKGGNRTDRKEDWRIAVPAHRAPTMAAEAAAERSDSERDDPRRFLPDVTHEARLS